MVTELSNSLAEKLVLIGVVGGCAAEVESGEAERGVDEVVEVVVVSPLVIAVAGFGLEGVEVFLAEDGDVFGDVVELGDVEELFENLLGEAGGEGNSDGVGGEGGEFVGEEGF